MSTLVARKVDYNLSDADLYETPTKITEIILNRLDILKNTNISILEPANGRGAISNVIKKHGFNCDTSDISTGTDFLTLNTDKKYDLIITNPPYKFAQEFVEKSLTMLKPKGQVVMLLRLSFLESAKRYNFFKDSGLKEVHVSSKRITMYPANGNIPKNSGTVAYAWYVWEKDYKDEPKLYWFNNT